MSDKEREGGESKKLGGEAEGVGQGERSLSNWQRLALARQGGGGADPRALLANYGVDTAAFAGGDRAGLAALERRLAFSGEVERDALGVHRAAALVVGPVAVAVAGVAAAAGVAVCAAAAAGNVAYVVNAVQTANLAYTANATSGDKLIDQLPAADRPQDPWW